VSCIFRATKIASSYHALSFLPPLRLPSASPSPPFCLHCQTSKTLAVWTLSLCCAAPLTLLQQLLTHHIVTTAYNLFLSPLRGFPGPRCCAASYWPYWLGHLKLRWHMQSKNLHDEYGDVVRIAPDRLDFIGAQAWRGEYRCLKTKQHGIRRPRSAVSPAC